MARGATPQPIKSQHAAPNLTTNYGSPNRSNTVDPLMPYQSLAIRGYVASGNAMEIYGSRRAEQTPLSPPVCETPANGPLRPLEGLRYVLLHPYPIGCACSISSREPDQGDLVRVQSAWSCPNFKSACDGYNAVRRRKHLPGLILPNRNSRKKFPSSY